MRPSKGAAHPWAGSPYCHKTLILEQRRLRANGQGAAKLAWQQVRLQESSHAQINRTDCLGVEQRQGCWRVIPSTGAASKLTDAAAASRWADTAFAATAAGPDQRNHGGMLARARKLVRKPGQPLADGNSTGWTAKPRRESH